MTVDARIVHKWMPIIKVEDFEVKFPSIQGLSYLLKNARNEGWGGEDG